VLAATDPAQPYGAALPWPKREAQRRPARTPGGLVVLAGSEPVLYLERGGRALQSLVAPDDPRIPSALQALAEHARAGRIRRIALEKVDGEPVMGTPWEAALAEVGFRAGPRRLTLSA
jgi:ATP-dependent Lhr-like helicase